MSYIENPKTKGSGVLCAIPQTGACPVKCADCFFQSGRSFLEPLDENLPNLPTPEQAKGHIVRMNDGNDSNNQRDLVMEAASKYERVFYNTSMPKDLAGFGGPVVLTVNPGKMTDKKIHKVNPVPDNLMFVRFRANTWNGTLCEEAVEYYTERGVPVVLTFMAYYTQEIPAGHEWAYTLRPRTTNTYHVIRPSVWDEIMGVYADAGNALVYACGKDAETFACQRCGNCVREYFVTSCRIGEGRKDDAEKKS